jgi:NADH:ubiquinone oxidoreductase subunit F (NADH-binding)/ferredoxin
LGPRGYATAGTPEEPGTVLLTVGGSAARPGVVECPTGFPLIELLRTCGASVGDGVLVGGFHGSWIGSAQAGRAEISRAGMARVGGTLGAGIILPIGTRTCPLGEVAQIARYLAAESAGQCGPCKLGLPDLAGELAALVGGTGRVRRVGGRRGDALERIRTAAEAVRGRGACSHPDGTARLIASALRTFGADAASHVTGRGCGRPVLGVLPVPGAEPVGQRLVVDWARCDGHGLCAHLAPELVRLDRHGYPILTDASVSGRLEPRARKAISGCPALALRLG